MAEQGNDIFDEVHEAFNKTRGMTVFGKYSKDMKSLGHIPDNQFDHAYGLIRPSPKDIDHDDFNFLEDQNKFLGNVKNARELRFYQNDNFFLTLLYNMGKKDPSERIVFQVLWANFKDEIRMTCNIGGEERARQSFDIPSHGGGKGGMLNRKKKQKTMEYVMPQDDGQ